MENFRVVEFCEDFDHDEIPEILTIQAKIEDISESSASEYTGKFSNIETDQDFNLETIKKLQFENESILKEKAQITEDFESEIQELNEKNDELESENFKLAKDLKRMLKKLETLPALEQSLEEANTKNRELEALLAQKDLIIDQLKQSNKVLEGICEGKEDADIGKKVWEMDRKYLKCLEEIEELKNQLISVNVMYAESETQKELIIKKFNDQSRPGRCSGEFSRCLSNN